MNTLGRSPEDLIATARFYDFESQPAVVFPDHAYAARRNSLFQWLAETPATIETHGSAISLDEFNELRCRGVGLGEGLVDNLNFNVMLEHSVPADRPK
jgi:hypothetical protein